MLEGESDLVLKYVSSSIEDWQSHAANDGPEAPLYKELAETFSKLLEICKEKIAARDQMMV